MKLCEKLSKKINGDSSKSILIVLYFTEHMVFVWILVSFLLWSLKLIVVKLLLNTPVEHLEISHSFVCILNAEILYIFQIDFVLRPVFIMNARSYVTYIFIVFWSVIHRIRLKWYNRIIVICLSDCRDNNK